MNDFAEGYAIGRDTNGGNNGGWGDGNGFLWIIALAILFGRNGFGGFGGGSGCCNCATQADLASGFNNSAVLSSLNDIKLTQSSNLNFINQGFAGLNNVINQGFAGVDNAICNLGYNQANLVNGISREVSDCCCKLGRGLDNINYNMATNTCALQNTINNSTRDLIDNQNANYRAIHEELVANRIEAKNERIAELTAKVNALQLEASQQAQNAFITANQEAQTAELIRRLGRDCPVPSFLVPNPNCCYNPCNNNGCCGGNNGF